MESFEMDEMGPESLDDISPPEGSEDREESVEEVTTVPEDQEDPTQGKEGEEEPENSQIPAESDKEAEFKEIEELIAEIEESLSSPAEGVATSDCSADLSSSPPTDQGADPSKPKRLSKHKIDSQLPSDDSARSLTPEEAALPIREPKTPPPMSPKETQTDWQASGVEIINLPLLKEMKRVAGAAKVDKKVEERVLGTGVTAHFKGPMPTVVLPLDKFHPLDSPSLANYEGRITPRGTTLEVVSTYAARTARNVVDAQVTYRDGKKGGIRVDIDGGGLQLVLDVTQKKKKRPNVRKIKRQVFSIRPPKIKLNLAPSEFRKLAWLEDKAEEYHVQRMQVSRDRKVWKPQLANIDPPDFGPRWRDWEVCPYSDESPTKKVGRTFESAAHHAEQMELARALEAEKNRPRQLASPPQFIPPPSELPQGSPSVYEDETTKRLREAKEYYARLSVTRNQPSGGVEEVFIEQDLDQKFEDWVLAQNEAREEEKDEVNDGEGEEPELVVDETAEVEEEGAAESEKDEATV